MESTDAAAAAAAAAAAVAAATAPDFSQYVTPSCGNQIDQTDKIAALEKRVDFLENMLLRLLPKTNMTPASEVESTEKDSKETGKLMTGKLIMWSVDGGYGFIKVEGQKDNIFLHVRGCKEGGKLRSIVDKSEGGVPDKHSKDSPAKWAERPVRFSLKKLVKDGETNIVANKADFV